MKLNRELIVTRHAVQRYMERVEHTSHGVHVSDREMARVTPLILSMIQFGRLLDTADCAVFVAKAAEVLGGRRVQHSPMHWGNYYYEEHVGAVAVVSHDGAVMTVLVPNDHQMDHLHRSSPAPMIAAAASGIQLKSAFSPPSTRRKSADLEICICSGGVPSISLVEVWARYDRTPMTRIYIDEPNESSYRISFKTRPLPTFSKVTQPPDFEPNTEAAFLIRDLTDPEIRIPRRVICMPDWAMLIMSCILGKDAILSEKAARFEPGLVYAISLLDERPFLSGLFELRH